MEWLTGNLGTVCVLLILCGIVFLAIRSVYKTKKSGGCPGCDGGCPGCPHALGKK